MAINKPISDAYKKVKINEATQSMPTNLGYNNPTIPSASSSNNMTLPQIVDNVNKLKLQLDAVVVALTNYQKTLQTQTSQNSQPVTPGRPGAPMGGTPPTNTGTQYNTMNTNYVPQG
jgi:hypothetical protein